MATQDFSLAEMSYCTPLKFGPFWTSPSLARISIATRRKRRAVFPFHNVPFGSYEMATDLGLSAPIRGFWHGFLGTVLRAFNGLKMFHVDKIYIQLFIII